MTSVSHAGSVEATEWDELVHSALQDGSVEEATALDGGGGDGGHLQVTQSLWAPPGDGDLLLIPGTGDLGVRRRLAGGGQELILGKGGVEEEYENPQQGGGGAAGVRIFL